MYSIKGFLKTLRERNSTSVVRTPDAKSISRYETSDAYIAQQIGLTFGEHNCKLCEQKDDD